MNRLVGFVRRAVTVASFASALAAVPAVAHAQEYAPQVPVQVAPPAPAPAAWGEYGYGSGYDYRARAEREREHERDRWSARERARRHRIACANAWRSGASYWQLRTMACY